MIDLRQLIERVEAATPGTEYIVLFDALTLAHKQGWISDGVYDQAKDWLGVGARLQAALTLVPEGVSWGLHATAVDGECCYFAIANYRSSRTVDTPALALVAAALKAREADDA